MNLKEFIKSKDLRQVDIAEHCGVHFQTISNIVRGTGKNVSYPLLAKMAGFLGVGLDELVGMCDNLRCRGLEDMQAVRATEENQPKEPDSQDIGVDAAAEVPSMDEMLEEEDAPSALTVEDFRRRMSELQGE